MASARTPAVITLSVWKALFLREAVSRISTGRAAWLWLLLEPLIHIGVLLIIFIIFRMRTVGGIDTTVWLMVGMMAFLTFRRTATQSQNAVDSNRGLFTYRQVKPVDTVLVRAVLEGFLAMIVALILFCAAAFWGASGLPYDPLSLLEAFLGLWLLGLGFGLITSVAGDLIPEVGNVIGFIMTPMYFASGVIFPVAQAPQPYRDWLLLNPILHGLESARLAFSPYYNAAPNLSIAYLYGFALTLIFLGLILHVRFSAKLVAQ